MLIDESEQRRHTISVLVANRFGVLARVAGLFSGRGYNIESLTVNATVDPEISHMTIVTKGNERILDQIDKQLNKLIDVRKVTTVSGEDFLERELMLLKVSVDADTRPEVVRLVEDYGATIVTIWEAELGIEYTGTAEQNDLFLDRMRPFGLIEVIRSGRVAMTRKAGRTESIETL